MCAPSGSGKSTAAQKLWHIHGGHYISRDEVRFSMITDEDEYFAKEDEVFDGFIKMIRGAINSGENVYIDATHLTPKARHKTMVRLQSGNYQTIAVGVEVPLETALERNAKREGRSCVPETVIRNMYRSYSRPRLEENWFDEIWVIDENDHAKVVERRVNDA